MSIFKKFSKILSLGVCVSLLCSLMISPASAAITGSASVLVARGVGTTPNQISTSSWALPLSMQFSNTYYATTQALASITTSGSTNNSFDYSVGLYASFYPYCFDTSTSYTPVGNVLSSSGYSCSYTNTAGVQGTIVGGPTVSTFTPSTNDSTVVGTGVTLKATFVGSPESPLRDLTITGDYTNSYWQSGNKQNSSGIRFTSIRLIEASEQDLSGLEGIADQIVMSNDILSAMYGDVMEVLNAIYQRTGDMLQAQNLANSYFNSMVNYLNSINTNTVNIYSLLQSQFQLLIATINTASSDIQGAISKQTEDLKTYFDSVFNSAVGTLPDDTDSAQGVIDDAHENDEQYTADALGKFEEISATFQGFDGSVGSGVAVASTLFSRVWTAMGDYVIVYTFPLTLALALVIVGRLSRVHSKDSSKSKGGDDSG